MITKEDIIGAKVTNPGEEGMLRDQKLITRVIPVDEFSLYKTIAGDTGFIVNPEAVAGQNFLSAETIDEIINRGKKVPLWMSKNVLKILSVQEGQLGISIKRTKATPDFKQFFDALNSAKARQKTQE